MSLVDDFENDLQLLLFNNDTVPNFGDSPGLAGSTLPGDLFVALHTSPGPGESPANQGTNEATYPGYTRQAVARTTGGWTISGADVSNTAQIQFGQATSGSQTVTHFSIGTGSAFGNKVIYSGALTASLNVTAGVNPTFSAGQLKITVN